MECEVREHEAADPDPQLHTEYALAVSFDS
jgi:hypothetical protein